MMSESPLKVLGLLCVPFGTEETIGATEWVEVLISENHHCKNPKWLGACVLESFTLGKTAVIDFTQQDFKQYLACNM